MIDPTPVNPGFIEDIISLLLGSYKLKVLLIKGLGPTRLISPSKIFNICGNSFILVFLRKLPKGSILESFLAVYIP